uniref:Calpain catalytic domain-containing protein n=1 Tax=Tetraselmis sp. GSL018 TaxID=582737 RepID=A0A061R6S0_9CHLO
MEPKAYAKAHGSYHAISGGHIHEAMLDLTGAPTESVALDDPEFDSEEAWAVLCSASEAGFLMGCATAPDPTLRGVGLVGCHAYSILEVKELHGVQPGAQATLTGIWAAGRNDGAGARRRRGAPSQAEHP